MRAFIIALTVMFTSPVQAQTPDLRQIVENHVIVGYQSLADETAKLAGAAAKNCTAKSETLKTAYHGAFDAWVSVSHLRFGPSESDDRAFSMAFWPDPRGSTPKALSRLIHERDPAVGDPVEFATVSIAGRGFYALEFLLFDPQFTTDETAAYRCALVQAMTKDIAANAQAILEDWQNSFANLVMTPGNATYRSATEVNQQFFTALLGGLEFTSDVRLGRPMGTFERPRPKRAEARRAGRSLRHVVLSLEATQALAALISMNDERVIGAFDSALVKARQLDDPVFAGVSDPQGRLRVEVLKQAIDDIRDHLATEVGPRLGIAAGFNSLDGD